MESTEKAADLKTMPNGQVFVLVAPNIQASISGAYKAAFYRNGKIALKYMDESLEVAKFTQSQAQSIADKGMENWFHVVSEVQSKRGTEDSIFTEREKVIGKD